MKKKFLCLALALAMLLSLVACGGNNNNPPADTTNPPADTNNPADNTPDDNAEPAAVSYLDASHDDAEIYDLVLGDFYAALSNAKTTDNKSERYALMAVAEAKLMEAGVMVPNESNGGNYAISRVAVRTAPTPMYGSDNDRFETIIIATDFIKAEDRTALVSMWADLKGTGTYNDAAKQYLLDKGYTLADSYNFQYTSDPETWDVLSTFKSVNSEPTCMTTENLLMHDSENTIKGALAESWEVSDDGLTYTFHLRDGLVWVDSQGRKVADLVADDFVAAMQHVFDCAGGQEELYTGVIKGAESYGAGEILDFAEVGVSAPDEKTVVYTLEQPTPYFESMLTYCGAFSPLSRSYYESKGGKFGAEFDAAASDYTYGKTPNDIAYCGPFLCTNWTEKNIMAYQANPSYWNAENGLNVHSLSMLYNDGTDTMKAYNDAIAGVIGGCGLNSSSLIQAKNDGMFDDYAYVSSADGSSFMGWYNLNRQAFANANDATKAVSSQSEEDAARTHAAMLNQNFRLALGFALDRGSYRAQSVGEDTKFNSMRNAMVPGTFVELEEDTTIDINGTATTFPAGTYYGEIVQAQIDADGYPIKVWDPEGDDGLGSGDNFDGWYNVDNAKAYMAKAVEELAAQGLEITAESPIQIDVTFFEGSELWTNRMNVYKQSLESALDGLVQVNLVGCASAEEWYYSGYLCNVGSEMNFNVSFTSGWSADYADPGNYLDTVLPDGGGYQTINMGLW